MCEKHVLMRITSGYLPYCRRVAGLQKGTLLDAQISASSSHVMAPAHRGRLNLTKGTALSRSITRSVSKVNVTVKVNIQVNVKVNERRFCRN